ncbi:uncharacterized protein LOC114741420 [Neltuma alba]|uniref:uncharacterized protein LOC114741420 n=1 Tax=Neltuma alba TaxID=207710 RepID=UPI0010A45904|nr:uncharacterized protein LOC114741420 [Prosopis alba]
MEALTLVLPSRSRTSPASSPSCRRRRTAVVRASGGREHQWGRVVDENMIVLRLRIREMKMKEKKKEEENEEGYGMMDQWERKYYEGQYGEHVCAVVGLLQSYLMNVRPCFAVGMLLLVAFSVFLSSELLLFNSVDMVKALFSSLFGLRGEVLH